MTRRFELLSGIGMAGLGVDLLTLSLLLVVVILIGLVVQGARIEPPSLLHSLAEPQTADAILLEADTPPEVEPKGKSKAPKS